MKHIFFYSLLLSLLSQNVSSQNNILKFDGLYQTTCLRDKDNPEETNYFIRFYPNGKVIEVGTECDATPLDLENWFNLDSKDVSIGTYKLKNNKISFQTKNIAGLVNYRGRILDNETIILKSHSLINGNRDKDKYYYIK